MLDMLGLVLGLVLGQPHLLDPLLAPEVTFHPRERAVSDWRRQAALNLDLSPGRRAALLLGQDPAGVTRCVRLNNYWCIKRGGWSGEIAADADGHVAFLSAFEGATVAALLLRRYYVDYGLHSAMAIVSRWAPASCGGPTVSARHEGAGPRGIGRTLRARWLAAHGHRVAGRGRTRVSAVPDRLIGTALPAPVIAIGLGSAPLALSASLPDALAGAPANPPPGPACAADAARIAHYARAAVAGIAGTVTADLDLFDREGRPTLHLSRLMRNMAAVEIGPLGVAADLVETAVAHATAVVAGRRAAAPGGTRPGRLDEVRRPGPQP